MTNKDRVSQLIQSLLDDARKATSDRADQALYALDNLGARLEGEMDASDTLRARIARLEQPVTTDLSDRGRERVSIWFADSFIEGQTTAATIEQHREVIADALNGNQELFDDALAAYIEAHDACPDCEGVASGDTCKFCGRKTEKDDRGHFRREREK